VLLQRAEVGGARAQLHQGRDPLAEPLVRHADDQRVEHAGALAFTGFRPPGTRQPYEGIVP
jgi:hypothetical protein